MRNLYVVIPILSLDETRLVYFLSNNPMLVDMFIEVRLLTFESPHICRSGIHNKVVIAVISNPITILRFTIPANHGFDNYDLVHASTGSNQ